MWNYTLQAVMQMISIRRHGRTVFSYTRCHKPQAVKHRDGEPNHHNIRMQRSARGIVEVYRHKGDCDANPVSARISHIKLTTQVEDQQPPTGPLKDDWYMNNWISSDAITAPVVAKGLVYLGAVNSHRLRAYHAKTGAQAE